MFFANVSAGFICCCYDSCGARRFLGILGAPWSLVYMGGIRFANVHRHVYRTRVTEVCLSMDTPFGRRSVGKNAPHVFWGKEVIPLVKCCTC